MDHALYIAERIRSEIENTKIEIEEELIRLTVSLGVCQMGNRPNQNSDELLKELIHQADQALYTAKETGRNCVVRFSF